MEQQSFNMGLRAKTRAQRWGALTIAVLTVQVACGDDQSEVGALGSRFDAGGPVVATSEAGAAPVAPVVPSGISVAPAMKGDAGLAVPMTGGATTGAVDPAWCKVQAVFTKYCVA